MEIPNKALTLDVAQIEEISRHFSSFRHDVNGCLALVVAATELIRYSPTAMARMTTTLIEQPPKIAGKVREFVNHCERVLGLRSGDAWYPALWARTNQTTTSSPDPVTISPDDAKAIQTELLYALRELSQLGFFISGASALGGLDPLQGGEVLPNITDQLNKVAGKMESLATVVNKATKSETTAGRRMPSGMPTRPITFTQAEVDAFQQKLVAFQRQMFSLITPLLDLNRIARLDPQQLVPRAGEYSQVSPPITELINQFASDFDRTFGISRVPQKV